MADRPVLTVTRELSAEEARQWVNAAAILPAEKMDTPRGLWFGLCQHPDHVTVDGNMEFIWGWKSGFGSAGNVAVALTQHWEAKHGG